MPPFINETSSLFHINDIWYRFIYLLFSFCFLRQRQREQEASKQAGCQEINTSKNRHELRRKITYDKGSDETAQIPQCVDNTHRATSNISREEQRRNRPENAGSAL